MEIYFYFILVLFIISSIEIYQDSSLIYKKNKSTFLFLIYVISVVIIGLRWETGTDWLPYLEMFKQSFSLKNIVTISGIVEPGYLFLNWLCYNIYPEYSFFLLIHAIIFYFLIIYGLNKLTIYPVTTFLFIFCSTLGVMGSNRQLLAMALVFYFLTWAIQKRKAFIFVIIGAMQFHTTAFLTSSFYFLNRRIKTIYLIIILVIALIIGFTDLPGKLFILIGGGLGEATLNKTKIYSSEVVDDKLSLLGVIRRVIYLSLFLVLRKKIEKKYYYYNFFLNGYLVSSIIYLMFSNSLIILVNRGSLYFNILEGILLTSVFIILKKHDTKLLYLLFLLILSIVSLYQSISAYPELFDPYKGIWYNINYYRKMY